MSSPIRKNTYKIDITDNFYLLVFHKRLTIGSGVALSVYINNIEYLKYDCFGKGGHHHIYDIIEKTIYFKDLERINQINKSIDDIITNINNYIVSSKNQKIKNFQFDIRLLLQKLNHAK